MSAKVLRKFQKRFELNEEGIRRIYADIKKRVPEENHKDIIFEVFREDSLVYRTAEIDRVLSEDNDSTRKIKNITIEYADKQLILEINFDAENGAQFTVTGEDRDDVYLLSSELKEYIEKEVAKISSFAFANAKTILFAYIIILMSIMLYFFRSMDVSTDTEKLQKILSSNDIHEKLNYIIDTRTIKPNTTNAMNYMIALPIILSLSAIFPFRKIISYLYPGNIFLIGKQTSVIASRRSSAKNFFWGGIVALVIAISTGYYFFWLAK
ncbi:hypothetical protein H8F23_24275 [Pseudomonas sp. P155]|uniref:Uncharacterized protein n=1 Tax=Pseudomonas neuropathica TaxID=2730425 RepID=A0ABS0BPK3_9PSED|nr:hypothetical protein [Pseudomonas neuropathica]MBF6036379.1 hypothetical protein [Pseudomonas neuropathica]